MESQTEEVINITHLKKAFDGNAVLEDINLVATKGENLVILGGSGSGKSVTIKCLVGLICADSGSIKIFDKEMIGAKESEWNAMRRRVGFLFQSGALYESMTVKENMRFPLVRLLPELTRKEVDERIKEALVNVDLLKAIDKMPSELSGGMRKRIGLARTLIVRPEIICYDEPTTGLDPVTSKEISELILAMQGKYKTTSIIITHDVACAKIIANKVLILRNGKFDVEGTFDEVSKNEDSWIKAFFS